MPLNYSWISRREKCLNQDWTRGNEVNNCLFILLQGLLRLTELQVAKVENENGIQEDLHAFQITGEGKLSAEAQRNLSPKQEGNLKKHLR